MIGKIALSIFLSLDLNSAAFSSPPYPSVKEQHWMIQVPNVRSSNVHVTIKSYAGKPEYSLTCRSAEHSDQSFNYSGEFECRLLPIHDATSFSTLFTENSNQSRDWESRARFFSRNLRGKCADIPEFGARRTFNLRQMKIVLDIINPKFDRQGLKSITLDIDVLPDPSSRREIAAVVPFPKNAPRMCKLTHYFPRTS